MNARRAAAKREAHMDEQQNALPQEELDYTPDIVTLEDGGRAGASVRG